MSPIERLKSIYKLFSLDYVDEVGDVIIQFCPIYIFSNLKEKISLPYWAENHEFLGKESVNFLGIQSMLIKKQ